MSPTKSYATAEGFRGRAQTLLVPIGPAGGPGQ